MSNSLARKDHVPHVEKHLIEPSHGESSSTEVRLGSHGNPLNDFAFRRGGTKGVLFLIPFFFENFDHLSLER